MVHKDVKSDGLVCGVTSEVKAGFLRILYLLLSLPECKRSCPNLGCSLDVSLAPQVCI